ncbi:C40 family peptidase [Virgibacillus salexigens]|uniref:C40 family peptidase n=1 Tax=Virgibacillus salexigens TaxID=61016 RepID=UPI00190CCFD6|nr:C40 family peptidase [Virgibacillus salexigens]
MLKKSVLTVSAVAVVGFSSVFFQTEANAESINNLKDKQSEIQDNREEIKADLSDAESEIADVLIELEELNKEISQVNHALTENQKKMDETEDSISSKQAEVDKLEKEIKQLEEAIEKRFDILKERAVSYQQSGGNVSYLEVIFGSKSFGDFINRVSAVNKISDSDVELMEKQEADKKKVEEKQNKVLNSLEELKDMKAELEGIQATIKEQKQENESKKDTLKSKKQDLEALKDELQVKDSNLATLESQVQESIAAAEQPVASSDGGELQTLSKKSSPSKAVVSNGGGGLSTVINAGYQYLGVPYVWGGKTPSGFDCSGFVSWAFAQGGYSIPSSTSALAGTGSKVSYSNIQPGDIVFFDTYKKNGHVGIYIGGGKFIGSQSTPGLSVETMTSGYWNEKFNGHVRRIR